MSNLPSATIRKFFRESFVGTEPLKVKSAELAALAEKITQRLQSFDCIEFQTGRTRYEEKDRSHVVSFTVRSRDAPRYYYHSNSFELVRTNAGTLQINDRYRLSADVGSLDELVGFVQRCRDRLQRRAVQDAKRTKVRGLQTQAIVAHLNRLAKEDKFDYFTETRQNALWLYVRLEDDVAIEIKLSFQTFQQQLPQIRAAIADMRRLYDGGISFKVLSLSRHYTKQWIHHESL